MNYELPQTPDIRDIQVEDLDEANLANFRTLDAAAQQHPLVMKDGIYRFKADPQVMTDFEQGKIDLETLVSEVHAGKRDAAEYLKVLRDTGTSLSAYTDFLGSLEMAQGKSSDEDSDQV
jgi:hypothetical protein